MYITLVVVHTLADSPSNQPVTGGDGRSKRDGLPMSSVSPFTSPEKSRPTSLSVFWASLNPLRSVPIIDMIIGIIRKRRWTRSTSTPLP